MDGQVPTPVVGQGELSLHMLQRADEIRLPQTRVHALGDHQVSPDVPETRGNEKKGHEGLGFKHLASVVKIP